MDEYHVGCGIAGIYAGTVKPNGYEWRNKTEVTSEALSAAAVYLYSMNKEFRFTVHGKHCVMRIEELKIEDLKEVIKWL